MIKLKFLAVTCFSLLFAIASWPQASNALGAEVQTWQYDPQVNAVTARIANNSDKDITGFNMSITETFADGSVSHHEVLVDMLAAVVLAQNVKGTPDEERVLGQLGNGTLQAHHSRDKVFRYPAAKVVTNFQGVIDAIAYVDGTAEAPNAAALDRLKEHRNAEIRSHQKASQILKEVLADPTIQAPVDESIARLEKFLAVWKAQRHSVVDIEPGTLEAVVNDLKSAHRLAEAQHLSEAEFLQRYSAEKDEHVSMLSRHAQLKTRGAQ